MNDDRLRDLYATALARRGPADRGSCPSPEALRTLADGQEPEGGREPILDHVGTCPACHADLALLRAASAGAPAPARRAPAWWGLAAAGLVAAAGSAWWTLARDRPGLERGGEQSMEALAPGASTPLSGLVFAWRPVPGATGYEVRIAPQGAPSMHLGATQDTTLVPQVPLEPGRYEWWVRALLAGGGSVRSAPLRLTITP